MFLKVSYHKLFLIDQEVIHDRNSSDIVSNRLVHSYFTPTRFCFEHRVKNARKVKNENTLL